MVGAEATNYTVSTSQEGDRDKAGPSSLSPFFQSRIPAPRMVLPMVKVSFPTPSGHEGTTHT